MLMKFVLTQPLDEAAMKVTSNIIVNIDSDQIRKDFSPQ